MKHWRLIYLSIPLTVAVFAAILLANEWKNSRPAQGVGRMPEAVRYADGAEAVEEETAEYRLDSYTEGDGPAPEWWMPDEPMAAEWEDSKSDPTQIQPESNPIQRTDAGCPDWNVDSMLYGWDGHSMEAWEMDLFSRVFYLEFWGTSDLCCRAGADAMLRLWDSGEYGSTMGQSLSAVNYFGDWVYSTYPEVWNTKYDPEGLEWCRSFVEERFQTGIEFWVMYFQLGGYHDTTWSVPVMEVDGVYFSAEKGW